MGWGGETFIERETNYARIKQDCDGKWMCTRCPYKKESEKSLRNHLAMAHKETQSKNIQCPLCRKIQKYMGNL